MPDGTQAKTTPISTTLAGFVHGLRHEAIPAATRMRAKHLMLDAIGLGLAATRHDFAGPLLRGVQALGEGGTSPVLGSAVTLTPRNAVLVNAGLMHGLDYDDTHMKAIVHATTYCLPTALAAALEAGAGGADLVTAYVAGMEASLRVGMAVKGGFHHGGFHATAICAHFGAALVAGRLYGLTAEQLAAAQGIAASTASGIQVFLEEGAWTKRMHPGWGGVGGITAARLAQAGFVAPARPYEGRYGLFHSHLQDHKDDVDYAAMTAGLGTVWETEAMAVKPYPVCHFLHGCAEAAALIWREERPEPGDIAALRAFVAEPTMSIISEPLAKKRRPTTDYEAKFSAQFVTATSLLRGRFGLAELEPDSLADERLLSLSERVEVVVDPDTHFPTAYSGGVEVTLRDGRVIRRHIPVNRGAGERAISNAEIVEKYMDTSTTAIDRARAESLRDAVLAMEEVPLRELRRLLTTG
ncbi:MmgE/PrpD family protein [Falsiroseomonas sp. CW058]|uniref:MmgE/PrpD family protein n=1 Tax=Falsiroseomonas sp. CW058 TaxID=3388664 RepID=UPI003D318602